jgi:hypothetical protein
METQGETHAEHEEAENGINNNIFYTRTPV